MFTLKVNKTISAAHNLRGYKGKCEKLHGHNWKVEVEVAGPKLNKLGMLMDFHDIKDELQEVLDKFDHAYLNEVPPFDKINPTSENLAAHIFKVLVKQNPQLFKVTVWESDNACASYQEK
jgi:6-pyruvoyltetrahydropterin/6-carboxytetrahydropterin synthase